MTFGIAALLLMAGLIGILIYRGSGSIGRAVAGSIAVPLLALVLLAVLVPREWAQVMGAAGFFVLLVATVASLIWGNRPSA